MAGGRSKQRRAKRRAQTSAAKSATPTTGVPDSTTENGSPASPLTPPLMEPDMLSAISPVSARGPSTAESAMEVAEAGAAAEAALATIATSTETDDTDNRTEAVSRQDFDAAMTRVHSAMAAMQKKHSIELATMRAEHEAALKKVQNENALLSSQTEKLRAEVTELNSELEKERMRAGIARKLMDSAKASEEAVSVELVTVTSQLETTKNELATMYVRVEELQNRDQPNEFETNTLIIERDSLVTERDELAARVKTQAEELSKLADAESTTKAALSQVEDAMKKEKDSFTANMNSVRADMLAISNEKEALILRLEKAEAAASAAQAMVVNLRSDNDTLQEKLNDVLKTPARAPPAPASPSGSPITPERLEFSNAEVNATPVTSRARELALDITPKGPLSRVVEFFQHFIRSVFAIFNPRVRSTTESRPLL